MSRFFVPISEKDLTDKLLAKLRQWHDIDGNETLTISEARYALRDLFKKDLKVDFDFENFGYVPDNHDTWVGYHEFSNGLTGIVMFAGGDWEFPVYFLIYFDGGRLRAYVPEKGNLYNTKTKQAYGNDDEADLKNIRKRWPKLQVVDWEDVSGMYDYEQMFKDIVDRIKPKDANTKLPSRGKNG